MACIGLNVKVVYNPHGWSFNMGSRKNTFIAPEKLISHFCDAIICISETEKVYALREEICKEYNLHVIDNGTDIVEYKEEKASLSIPKDVFVVGMVGRICRQKAPDVFVKMTEKVHKEFNNSFLLSLVMFLKAEKKREKKLSN